MHPGLILFIGIVLGVIGLSVLNALADANRKKNDPRRRQDEAVARAAATLATAVQQVALLNNVMQRLPGRYRLVLLDNHWKARRVELVEGFSEGMGG